MMHPTKQTQQRASMIIAIAGIAGLVFLNRAVSSTQQPKPSATSAAVASASTSTVVEPARVGPTPKPYQRYADNPELAKEHVGQIVRETKGDWNKLSWDDKVLLNRMTQGRGREALLNMAQQQATASKSTSVSPPASAP